MFFVKYKKTDQVDNGNTIWRGTANHSNFFLQISYTQFSNIIQSQNLTQWSFIYDGTMKQNVCHHKSWNMK